MTDTITLDGVTANALAFQRVDEFRPPRSPGNDVPMQLHLEFPATRSARPRGPGTS